MKQNYEYAGSLVEEMAEADKLIPDVEEMNFYLTQSTAMCSAFLTIYCC